MFECPDCGGVIETTPSCYFCIACDYFTERRFVDLDGGRGRVNWSAEQVQVVDKLWFGDRVAA
jgi:CO dehydrogenase/acetyl-CoA synthase beta subunit